MRETPPDVLFEKPAPLWRIANLLDDRLDLASELCAQAGASRRIEHRGIAVFEAGLRVKRIPHLPTMRRTSAMTSSPGTGVTRPERTSSRRRRASAAHSV